MPKSAPHDYDAVIIGAGIGGLVCGCYLAKAGIRVLLVEQHSMPGGYCTSFKRRGFIFDAAAHSFGSYREGGTMNNVLRDLDVDRHLKITRYEPSDTIVSPDYRVNFWSDINRTSHELQQAFPHEASGIDNFVRFLQKAQPFSLAPLRNKTFKDLLNQFFADEKLKSILAFPVLGNGGLPPSQICAFTAVKIYTEFLLDGGYYPEPSMQSLADALAKRFTEYGGELLLSCQAKKIKVENGVAVGVMLDQNRSISSQHVVSGCDARQTYCQLVGQQNLNKDLLNTISCAIPSLSVFVAYLGIDEHFKQLPEPGVNMWVMPHYDIEEMFHSLSNNGMSEPTGFMMRMSPNKRSLQAFVNASFISRKFWSENKYLFLDKFIEKIQTIIPGLTNHISYKEAGTPYTMYRYTLNDKGAAYGWASTPSQFTDPALTRNSLIPGLYTTGHWSALIQGIPGVAYMGFTTAKSILKSENRIRKIRSIE